MRLVLLLLFAAGLAGASPQLTFTSASTLAPMLASGSEAPVYLAALGHNTTIGPNGTSARSSIVSSPGAEPALALASVTAGSAWPPQVRLALVAVEGRGELCERCTLELACGALVSEQIHLAGANVTASGAWLSTDDGCSTWTLQASAQAQQAPPEPIVLRYHLQQRATTGSSSADYTAMELTIR